jgi:hypothetical protein
MSERAITTKTLTIRSLVATALFAAMSTLANAGYIISDVGIWRLWFQYGTTNPYFDTLQEAFADSKARSDRCNNSNRQTCWSIENLRPDPNHPFGAWNGSVGTFTSRIRLRQPFTFAYLPVRYHE